ncbi:hypothetical protein ACJX0J_032890, partial [Zea mays]
MYNILNIFSLKLETFLAIATPIKNYARGRHNMSSIRTLWKMFSLGQVWDPLSQQGMSTITKKKVVLVTTVPTNDDDNQ